MASNQTATADDGSWVLEQLSLLTADVELAEARRAWHSARSAWPGAEAEFWWKWLAEAAHSIGLRTLTIDSTVADAARLVSGGARVVLYSPNEQKGWLLADLGKHGRINVQRSVTGGDPITSKPKRFRRMLQDFQVDGCIRCVVIRSDAGSGLDGTTNHEPLARLQALMRPEWPDIWIVIVFAFVVGLLTLATPIAVEALVNTVAFGRFLQPVVVLALILLTFLAFSAAMRALQTYVAELVQRRLFARIAGDLAFRLPRTLLESTDKLFLPELTNRFFDVVTVQKVAAQLLLDGVGLILSAVIGMGVLAFYHPWLLGFDVVMMASIAFIIIVLGRGAISSSIKESKNKYHMASWLEDIARCPTLFRTAGGTDLALERADRLIHEYLEARQKHFRILMRQILFALGLQAVASTVLLGLGGWLVIDGQLTLGQLVAAELIVTVIVGAFAKLGKHLESFYDLLASVDKLGALFDLPIEHQDGLLDFPDNGPAQVEARNVTYLKGGSGAVSPGVSFRVESGDSLALLGASGTGKSLLMDLVYGLRGPTSGHVTIDRYDPQDVRSDILRERVALVRRDEVFHGSLEENIHLHRASVTSADVRRSLEDLGLYHDVLKLGDGFDTYLNGDGSPLSATQRDRLCLARAIAGRPQLLLIDGVLDGLADEELHLVIDCLMAADRPWTLIIATGRRSIADRCAAVVRLGRDTETTVNDIG